MKAAAGWLAAALCTALAPAQSAPSGVHGVWLAELFDLDGRSAAERYAAIAADETVPAGDRLLALARLLELERIGVVPPRPLPDGVALPPAVLDAHRASPATPPAFDRLVARAGQQPESLPAWLQEQPERAASRFQPRPFVPQVVATALEAAHTGGRDDRRRQLQVRLQEALRAGERLQAIELRRQLRMLDSGWGGLRQLERSRALQVMRAELQGERETAAQLRDRWFRDWQPAPVVAPPEVTLRTALRNLNQLRGTGDLMAGEAELLAQLVQTLRAEAQRNGVAAALALLERLPLYRDRLLRELERDR